VAVTVPPPPPLVTVSATVVLRDTLPEVPVIVTLAAPNVAVLDAVNVAVTVLPVVAVEGLNATVTPVGSPLAAKLTAPVKLVRLMAMVLVAVAPRATEVAAPGPMVKSLPAVTVSDTGVARVTEPEVPVRVTVAPPSVAVPDAVNVAVTEVPVVAERRLRLRDLAARRLELTPQATVGPIDTPPYYAIRVSCGTLGTKGGPRTDEHSRVLNVDGAVIDGLYAAGNAMGSVME